jgi:hypothetical protein
MKLDKTVIRKLTVKEAKDRERDLDYWLQQPVSKRAEAVTFLISQSLKPGQRMDKAYVRKRKLKE